MRPSFISSLRQFDARRPGFPGEHLGAFGLGVALLRGAGRRRSTLARVASLLAGGMLVYRAASGRGGIRRFLR